MAAQVDPAKAFRAHSNYIDAIDTSISTTYGDATNFLLQHYPHVVAGLAASVRSTSHFAGLQVHKDADVLQVSKSLRNAWGTELLLEMSGTFETDEMLAVSNNWAVVWTYYVAYHATQALAVANGQARPTSHPATQRLFAEQWLGQNSSLTPWSIGIGHAGAVNLPPSFSVSQIHPWSTCDADTCWSLLAMALKTTRDDAVRERVKVERTRRQAAKRKAWHQQESTRQASGKPPRKVPAFPLPHLPEVDKAALDSNVRPTTLIDYLYRLRIRSNYVDTEMFTDGPEGPNDSYRVHRSLRLITSTTLLLYEMHVGGLLGMKVFEAIVDEWLGGHAYPEHTMALASRRAVLFP